MNENNERLFMLLSTVVFLSLIYTVLYLGTASERMAQQGFMPLRLQGESSTYWLPIPTNRASDELKEMLKH